MVLSTEVGENLKVRFFLLVGGSYPYIGKHDISVFLQERLIVCM